MKNLKKGILGMGVILTLFSGNILANSDLNSEEQKQFSQEYIDYLNLSDEEKSKVEIIPEKYDVDYDEFFKNYDSNYKTDENSSPIDEVTSIPTSFDLRNRFKINVENQGQEGNCWIFASLGAMRTHLALKNSLSVTPNLSERHLDYLTSNLYADKGFPREEGAGGNFNYALKYFMNNDGPVLEAKVPYGNSYSTSSELKALDNLKPDYYVHKTITFPTVNVKQGVYYNGSKTLTNSEVINFRNEVKKHIMTNGGVYCSVRTNSKFADSANKHYNQFDDGTVVGSECGGHALTIIGWDDSYSRNNFYGAFKPKKDGAWLALNSYGENWGYNGTQWVSYEDYKANSAFSGYISVDKTPKSVTQMFSNEKLYSALKKCYTSSNYPITSNDSTKYLSIIDLIDNMNSITSISLNNLGMSDEDIKQFSTFSFPRLVKLEMSNNNITNINPLIKYKNVKTLNLSINKINNIGPVTQLPNLSTLNAQKNSINTIDCLNTLENLKNVNLSNNKISDHHLVNVANFSTFTLQSQSLEYNTKLSDGEYSVVYPKILLRTKDSSDRLYSTYGMKYVGCKEAEDGKGILVDKTADSVYVLVKGGNLGTTRFSITNYDKLKKGDVNKDTKIDLLDVFLSYNKYLKYSDGSEIKWEDSILTDLNSDEKIDLLDIFLVYNKYLKENL